MNKIDLKQYLPIDYEGIVESEAQQDALSIELNSLNDRYVEALMDQFVQYASLRAIGYYENIFGIVANPETDSLEFRRERVLSRMQTLTPPYTYYYLRSILDGFFGKDRYTLDINNEEFTITIESSADDSLWYHEIQVSITAIKPCNMIYINKPRISKILLTNEQINSTASVRNYRLNGTWLLGLRPFLSISSEEMVKMPETKSIQQNFIDKSLDYWKTLFKKCKLNNSVDVTELNINKIDSNIEISYVVSIDMVNSITNIKLLDSQDTTLINSNVFIPIDDSVIIKHIVKLEEGINA